MDVEGGKADAEVQQRSGLPFSECCQAALELQASKHPTRQVPP